MSTKRNGLIALLGLGALAFWRYKKSTPEERQIIKDKCNALKDNLCKLGEDLKNKASSAISDTKNRMEH